MALDMKKLREELRKENEQSQKTGGTFDNASYPFWNIPENTPCAIRFLPDADENNPFFWCERQMINLEFAGIKGVNSNPIKVQVPCMEMYNEKCPVLTEARGFYKEGNDALGSKYWKKRSYLFQGFVRVNPLEEENKPENPIRRFIISPSIFKIIKSALLDEDMEDAPTDFENGTDFRIIRTKDGNYSDYTTSTWARKATPLTTEELEAVEKHGLFNLNDFMPKQPDADAQRAIVEMFEASLEGEAYDPDKFANYYKPYGLEVNTSSSTSKENTKTETKSDDSASDNTSSETTSDSKSEGSNMNANDLIARLRQNRK